VSDVGSRESGIEGLPEWDDLILVGVVARTHGIKGHVIVNPHSDFAEERFHQGAQFQARLADGTRTRAEITAVGFHRGRPIIGLVGVTTMDEAERYAGAELRIASAEQGPLPPGRYYHHQLVGCAVVGEDGESVGQVVAVEGDMGQSRLVVAGVVKRHEIPLADDICTVDLESRRIVIRPPAGLLDL